MFLDAILFSVAFWLMLLCSFVLGYIFSLLMLLRLLKKINKEMSQDLYNIEVSEKSSLEILKKQKSSIDQIKGRMYVVDKIIESVKIFLF